MKNPQQQESRWQAPQRRRRLRVRQAEERGRQRLILAVASLVFLIVFAVPAYGYYDNFVAPPRHVVTAVNETNFTLGHMLKILRMIQSGQEAQGQPLDMTTFPFHVLSDLENNEIVRQHASSFGIKVEAAQIDIVIKERLLGLDDEELKEQDPDSLAVEFKERYGQYLNQIGMSDQEYRDIVRADLLREKLVEQLALKVPRVQEHVHLYRIGLENSTEADDVLKELSRGGSLGELVEEKGVYDPQANAEGDLGWVPRGIYFDIDDQIFDSLNLGNPTEPMGGQADGAVFIYMATEKASEREVDDKYLRALWLSEYQRWILAKRDEARIKRCFGSGGTEGCQWQYDWLVTQIQRSSKLRNT